MTTSARSFLFLQGPHGPFFQYLGQRLRSRGHRIARINFNGGDTLDWMGSETVPFRGKLGSWPEFLAQCIQMTEATDLVLYGDCRPMHERAVRMAEAKGIRVHVFEEGYLRPDWVTLEQGGVNGNSKMPKDPAWYLDRARDLPDPAPSLSAGNITRAMMYHCSAYYAGRFAARRLFPHYRTHRPCGEWQEIRRWAFKLLRMKYQARCDQAFQKSFLSAGRRFFLFGLQLGSDYQIRRHSPYKDMVSVIVEVLTSFAAHAPSDVRLLVKNHPMDICLVDLEQCTLETAEKLGIRDRVFFTQGGVLPSYIKAAAGVVVVNSTLGMSSLHHKCPTLALGKAVYDIPGLTHGGGLDSFWTAPAPPGHELYSAFRRVLLEITQINGSFYTRIGIRMALPKAVDRLSGIIGRRAGQVSALHRAAPGAGLLAAGESFLN